MADPVLIWIRPNIVRPHKNHRHARLNYVSHLLGLLLVVFELALAFTAHANGEAVPLLKIPIVGGFVLAFGLIFLAAAHISIATASRKRSRSPLDEAEGLSSQDIASMLRLVPLFYKVIGALGAFSLISQLLVIGPKHWSRSSCRHGPIHCGHCRHLRTSAFRPLPAHCATARHSSAHTANVRPNLAVKPTRYGLRSPHAAYLYR